jgi:hypoxanthine phosphoribosyltransferase
MKVITLINKNFVSACKDLADKVNNSFFLPDVVIGIPTGGSYIGKIILKELNNKDIFYAEIKIQRNSTKRKEIKIVRYILKRIPRFLTNWIRMLESEALLIKSKVRKSQKIEHIEFDNKTDYILKQGNKNILLVDDAIDSGTTLNIIYSYIETHYPANKIKIAVITVTNNKPLIDADYYLYHNRVLIRFPWSNDA